jgi:hypothetical protein
LTGFINLTYFQIRKTLYSKALPDSLSVTCEEPSEEIKSSCERKGTSEFRWVEVQQQEENTMRTAQTRILSGLMLGAFLAAALFPRSLDAQTQKFGSLIRAAATRLRRSTLPQAKACFAKKAWMWN